MCAIVGVGDRRSALPFAWANRVISAVFVALAPRAREVQTPPVELQSNTKSVLIRFASPVNKFCSNALCCAVARYLLRLCVSECVEPNTSHSPANLRRCVVNSWVSVCANREASGDNWLHTYSHSVRVPGSGAIGQRSLAGLWFGMKFNPNCPISQWERSCMCVRQLVHSHRGTLLSVNPKIRNLNMFILRTDNKYIVHVLRNMV